jgi:hypothetical protein
MPRVTKKGNANILKGQSDFFEIAKKSLRDDKDIPDIVTFTEHSDFLGKPLFPRQRTLLKLINLELDNLTDYDLEVIDDWTKNFYRDGGERIGISPDIMERAKILKADGYNHFKEVINITGRRGGKGHIGGIQGAYINWQLLMLDDPQWHYGIDKSKDMYLFCVATNIQQAKQYQFADLSNTIIDAPCFQPYIADAKDHFLALRTPSDIRRIATFESRGIRPNRLIASIRNMAVTSNSKASRGAAAFSVMFDEFAHMLVGTDGSRTSEQVYSAITPALDQFGKDGFIYIPTSPFTKVGKAYDLYESALSIEDDKTPSYPNMMLVQLPSWGPYEDWADPRATFGGFKFNRAPQEYDNEMKLLEKREPDTFKVERRSQWAEVTNAYLNPKMVERMFDPFTDSSGETRILEMQPEGAFNLTYYGHCDPSKSGANTASMICHVEKMADPDDGEEWYHIIVDWMKVWNPDDYDDGQLDYEEIEEELVDVLCRYRTTKVFSFDQYGAFVTLPRLKRRLKQLKQPHKVTIKEAKFTKESNMRRAERFKSALGMGWIHSYKDEYGPNSTCLLEQELKFLQEINGRVDRQKFGPIRTSDISDCLMVCVDALLEDNFVKMEMRDRLKNTDLHIGAHGGYHTGNSPSWSQMGSRDKLKSFGAARSQRDYGGMSRGRGR